ncbi:putative transcriptional regulator YdeE [Mucilaginibacter oryzae]|uniref:Putative transcriptional regulator YdeE n=1 Tax=Mucilaginibacter oryzae TaxID=468058 RepID=A0A316HP21_9SPHI|nr:GyrI-like domain-containing protein [Mucilaginibacter oryzae]PWK79965.1 putative transcriptional regulator YdeE [Mucilaginibacter oryzae]
MDELTIKGFFLVGISVRTTNQNGQASKDIGALWNRFMSERILQQVVNRISDEIYCVYTDYESDKDGYYTTVLGCCVATKDNIPEGLICITVPPGKYNRYVAKGALPQAVSETWRRIWSDDIDRRYLADFDVYGERSKNREEAEVEIFVGVN